jgi:hypothetical protein
LPKAPVLQQDLPLPKYLTAVVRSVCELTDDELAVVDELEPVGDAETEADPEFDGDAVVADAADELSLVAD